MRIGNESGCVCLCTEQSTWGNMERDHRNVFAKRVALVCVRQTTSIFYIHKTQHTDSQMNCGRASRGAEFSQQSASTQNSSIEIKMNSRFRRFAYNCYGMRCACRLPHTHTHTLAGRHARRTYEKAQCTRNKSNLKWISQCDNESKLACWRASYIAQSTDVYSTIYWILKRQWKANTNCIFDICFDKLLVRFARAIAQSTQSVPFHPPYSVWFIYLFTFQ